ncbi:MAG: mechanosensitive ion channel family protein [Hydrogenophaga sp.]|jgi:small-conductance mechanosensitive channel|uniref:mechanosensitive ion channel family protein n=1 Tax=Hydrogenophaga sp. TaxID=1904254 RepID=UPI001DC4F06D|nr:mechanosensitive ion channel domain-containing protein [Hydrogenophaga sp.]MBW0169861.1 mechanosensitive ion channel [Hydrogenophaga sp.]MBW0185877.1 mechanosensitive ion channel [Hydrogenophaga sp.]
MNASANPKPIDDIGLWLAGFTQPTVLIELVALLVCVVLAWGLSWALRRGLRMQDDKSSVLFGRRLIDGVMFPLVLLLLGYVARALVTTVMPLAAFRVAIPVLVSLVVIRVGVKVLQAAFTTAPWVRALERTISWVAWLAMVLWVSGLLPVVLAEMEDITWKIGSSTLSLRTLIEGVITAGAVMILSLWVSAAIETRLLRKATGGDLSMRKAVSNATRALLLFVGLMIALSAVGIDLTALSVFSGAIGVGIGFGLQKLASNYVSGFVILAERRLRIGDNVKVDSFEGRILDINTRYSVIRSPAGRESIVPNELMVINRVENLSSALTRVWQTSVVTVGYDSDVELVGRLLLQAVSEQDAALKEPAPQASLSAFGTSGLEFTVGYWINSGDGAEQLRLLSSINLGILRLLREHGIEMPYPQSVVHVQPLPVPAAPGGASPGHQAG